MSENGLTVESVLYLYLKRETKKRSFALWFRGESRRVASKVRNSMLMPDFWGNTAWGKRTLGMGRAQRAMVTGWHVAWRDASRNSKIACFSIIYNFWDGALASAQTLFLQSQNRLLRRLSEIYVWVMCAVKKILSIEVVRSKKIRKRFPTPRGE